MRLAKASVGAFSQLSSSAMRPFNNCYLAPRKCKNGKGGPVGSLQGIDCFRQLPGCAVILSVLGLYGSADSTK
jgi:hypothetical protein